MRFKPDITFFYILLIILPVSLAGQGIIQPSGLYMRMSGGAIVLNSGNWINNGTYTDAGGTVIINSSSQQEIGGSGTTQFYNVTIDNSAGVTGTNNLSVDGNLNLASANVSGSLAALDMGTNTLTMGTNSTTTGIGDVTGIIRRTTIDHDIAYTFGNQFTTMTFSNTGTLPTDISFKIGIGTAPSWKTDAVLRTYDIIRTGGNSDNRAILNLHYLDGELNSNPEGKLVLWDMHVNQGNKVEEHGKSNQSLANNWIGYSSFGLTYFDTDFGNHTWTLAKSSVAGCVWLGAISTRWNEQTNWTCARIPTASDTVYIPDAEGTTYDPTLPPAGTANTLTIQVGGVLNGGIDSTLTISGASGAWFNEGTFNPGTSTIIFTNPLATMADPTNFYNVTINSGASLTMGTNNTMRIAGTMTNNGTWNAGLNGNLVEYNGTIQTIVNPNGSPAGYHDLIVSGSGAKTLPATALNVAGDFSLSGNVTATAGANLTVAGNITIGSGATFEGSASSHNIAGNWINNGGTFSGGTSTVTFNGAAAQTIAGTSSTTFNNLTLNNINGLGLGIDETINGILTFTNGKIATGSHILTLGADASTSGAGAGKYIFGKLQWSIPTGSPSRNFVIGDATYYAPVSISFADVTTPGTLLASTTPTVHPEIMGSGINALKAINRYWSFTNASTAFTTYSAVFTFVPEDLDPGVNTDACVVKRWEDPEWYSTTAGAKTSTTTQITAVSSFSDFQDGEACISSSDPTSASATATTICSGGSTVLSINGGGGGSNETIQWYTGSCGGTSAGSGNGLVVSPTATTTYYGRYENSSSCSHTSACVPITITVNQRSSNPVSAAASLTTICSGQGTTLTLQGGGGGTGEVITWYANTCAGTFIGTGNALTVYPTTTTTYYGRYEDGAPCDFNTACRFVEVIVNKSPVVTWSSPLAAQCIAATSYSLTGGTPSGGSYSGAGVSGTNFNASVAGTGSHSLTYSYTTSAGCPGSANNSISVYPMHKISGNYTYYNTSNTSLDNDITVGLYDYPGGTQVGSNYTINGSNGYYEFTALCAGTYEVRASSTVSADGSVNTTDAAQVNNWGAHPYSIEKVRFYAGDVTGSQFYINSTDALRIQNHFVYGTPFDRDSWTFWRAGETIGNNTLPSESYPFVTLSTTQDATANFYGLCTGDFNRSFIPGSSKSANTSLQLNEGRIIKTDSCREVGLSMRMAQTAKVGAISMILDFPANLAVVKDITVNAGVGQLDWSVKGNELRIGWNSSIPVLIPADTSLLTIMVKTTRKFTPESVVRLSLVSSPLNELADDHYEVIGDAVLKSDILEGYSAGMGEVPVQCGLALNNYPNPFSNSTTISYTLPSEGFVTMEISSILGTTVSVPVSYYQQAGHYLFEYKPVNVPPGVYITNLRFDGKGTHLSKTIKMVINR